MNPYAVLYPQVSLSVKYHIAVDSCSESTIILNVYLQIDQ